MRVAWLGRGGGWTYSFASETGASSPGISGGIPAPSATISSATLSDGGWHRLKASAPDTIPIGRSFWDAGNSIDRDDTGTASVAVGVGAVAYLGACVASVHATHC